MLCSISGSMAASADLMVEAKEAFFIDELEKSLELFTRAIEVGPPTAALYSDRAQVHIKLHNYREAISDCEKAMNLDGAFFNAYYRQGISYMGLKLFEDAESSFKGALCWCSDHTKALELLNECSRRIDEGSQRCRGAGVERLPDAFKRPSEETECAPKVDDLKDKVIGNEAFCELAHQERKNCTKEAKGNISGYDFKNKKEAALTLDGSELSDAPNDEQKRDKSTAEPASSQSCCGAGVERLSHAFKKPSDETETSSKVDDLKDKIIGSKALRELAHEESKNWTKEAKGTTGAVSVGNVSGTLNAERLSQVTEKQKGEESTTEPASSQSLGDDRVIEKEIHSERPPQPRKNNDAETEAVVNVGLAGAARKKKRTLTLRNKRIWDTSNLPPVAGSSVSMSNQALGDSGTNVHIDLAPVADNVTVKEVRKIFIIYDYRMLEHRPKANDDECPARIRRIIEKLENSGLSERCEVSQVASEAPRQHILAVHTNEEYVNAIDSLSEKGKQSGKFKRFFTKEMVSSKGSSLAVHLAAGALLEACDRVAVGGFESAFAVVRPPGHHAAVAYASGFCFLNNIAIAARYLQSQHKFSKILIVDFDVHHGDGTQSVFYDDDTVMYCSIHRGDIDFPLDPELGSEDRVGQGKGKGFNVNLRLDKEINDGDMLAAFDFLFLPLAHQFQPDFVLVSAGFDTAINDHLGKSLVTPCCFRELVWRLKGILDGKKIVLALEGGYNLESLSESCAESVKALLDGRGAEVVETTYEGVDKDTWDRISLARTHLKGVWPIFAEKFKPPGAGK